MSEIVSIEITHHQLPLDPAFPASWDPRPRTKFPATIVRVRDSNGREGVGSGDVMYGFDDYARYFVGEDPLDLPQHAARLANTGFHAGRPWPLDVALWDLAGKIEDRPIWRMLGGTSPRLRLYASSAVHRSVPSMVETAQRLIDAGFEAMKVRFGRPSIDDDLAVVGAIRDAIGDRLTLMVDCNQGWRMPWDTARPWDVETAWSVAQRLMAAGVYWMEEPLHRGDYAGMTELRRRVHAGRLFTPHTWGNGVGVLANLHLAAGVAGMAGSQWVEWPFDPPEWSIERRDYPLAQHLVADGGWCTLADAPGLGCELDEEMLARTASDRATFE